MINEIKEIDAVSTKTEEPASYSSEREVSADRSETSEAIDSELIKRYLPLVKQVVYRIMKHLPSHMEQEDLHSVGIFGLLAAIRKYNPLHGETFEAYATLRIRGAILDELRRLDSMPRTARAKSRRLQKEVQMLEQRLGRAPADEEIRKSMDLTPREFSRMMKQVRPVSFVSLDNGFSSDNSTRPDLHEAIADDSQVPSYESIQKRELYDLVYKKIKQLPDRQKKILAMYYFEGLRLTEIAEVFSVSEARICQIHVQTLKKLRTCVLSVMTQ